ncbi:hypothetical protein ColTof4_04440 [Colletotrichum tofieldiae]|nr:hypothetical protein ColTof3_11351 [Colletotrichum tofieldiae]GKT72017.1 hypothetical protein ColTof4_04440 [Colletotrichum tofieldiae]
MLGLKILNNGLLARFIPKALERHPKADETADSAADVLYAALEGKQQRYTWFEILEREPARSSRARTAINVIDLRSQSFRICLHEILGRYLVTKELVK